MGLLKNKNFAYSTLAGTVLIGAASLTVATGEGALFPATGDFMMVIYGATYPSPCLDSTRELVKATLTSGDTFAITRAQEGTVAKEWAADDNVALVLTAGKMDELEKAVQNSSLAFGTATGTNTYAVTLDPALTAYATGIVVNVKFTNASTGASTLNVNALGAKKIYKFVDGSYSVIGSGDIANSMFSSVFYDATLDSAAGGWILGTFKTTLFSNVVEDTTPQLGGNLDMNGKNIQGVTPTEVGYLSGVISAIQTQLNGKQATITGAATTIVSDDLTAEKIVVTSGIGKITYSSLGSSTLAAIPKGFARANSAGTFISGYNATTVKNSTGNYTVTWGTDFETTNYTVSSSLLGGTGYTYVSSVSVDSCTVLTFDTSWTAADKAFTVIAMEA